ncbi:hypothetical protein ACOTVK_05570 [Aliarcobacter butzleri]
MNVLYLTDNRDNYTQGNYYVDWLNAFKKRFPKMVVYGPGYDTTLDEIPSKVDFIVYGHAFMELYLQKKFYFFSSKKFYGLDLSRYKDAKSIMFSKNEYKLMNERIEFLKMRKNSLLVCYTKQTLDKYKSFFPNIHWAPFGIDKDRFYDKGFERDISIGMRGNRHGSYIGQLRENTANKLIQISKDISHDIKLSDNGEDFLFGDEYINWLNRCMFIGNTKSAMDIVNPKFAETIACGAIPVCPVDFYEGLLEKDKHYVDIEEFKICKNIEELNSFYNEKRMIFDTHKEDYINKYSYENMLHDILKKL